ncbi:MAG: hypothetical protein M3421_05240 [Bacteroidota bacterium]|nr:hypothetical protein [Bacteroidota bacterium]
MGSESCPGDGIKKFFVARDGQIYLKVAKILKRKLNLDIELRYLYGSRKAWHFPSVTNLSEEIHWITRNVSDLSIRTMLGRVSTKPEEIKDILEQNGFPQLSWDLNLNNDQIKTMQGILLQKDVESIILEKAKVKRQILFKFYQQEGLTLNDDWAMVDVGWGGNSQNFMGKILKLYGAPLPKGFYFALKAKEQGESHGLKEGYLVDKIINVGYAKLLDNIQSLMESFCTADHGSVIGYEQAGDMIKPVLSSEKNDKVVDWELEIIQKTVSQFTESLFLNENYVDSYVHLRPLVAKIIETFARNPSKEEALAWGSFQLEENAFEIKFLPLAQPYKISHLFQILKNGDPLQHKLSWVEGALAMTHPTLQKLVIFTAKVGRYLRKRTGKTISKTKF